MQLLKGPNKKVLIFIDYFFPGYKAGGILRSVYNLVNNVRNIDFFIVTRDRDLGEKQSYSGVSKYKWIKNPHFYVMYLSQKDETVNVSIKIIDEISPDYIYVNCIYSFRYSIIPIVIAKIFKKEIKFIVAVNGMLSKEALNLKRVKKYIFLKFIRLSCIYRHVTWHATNTHEQRDIFNIFGKSINTIIAPYIVDFKHIKYYKRIKHKNDLRLCYISRISKKKNLLWAINLLKNVKTTVNYKIIGPIEDVIYFDHCMNAAKALPSNVTVEYIGEIPFHNVILELQEYHFLFFPTLHENFGHVIIESMLAGCPVIISKNTPFHNLNEINAGWNLSLENIPQWVQVIEYCSLMEQDEYNLINYSAYQYAKRYINDYKIIELNYRLFG